MSTAEPNTLIAWLPDLLYTAGKFQRNLALVCDASGTVVKVAGVDELRDEKRVRLSDRAMPSFRFCDIMRRLLDLGNRIADGNSQTRALHYR